MRIVERRADALICVSRDMIKQYKTIFKNSRHICIYNVVKDRHSEERIAQSVDEPWLVNKTSPVIISAGRLAPEKGYLDLIRAVKELLKTQDIKLLMLGEGPMRKEIEELIIKEELSSNVKLLGFQSNPLKYYSKVDVFVLSSYVEGLPNVLVEAMMCGCTPVSTDCPTGPREVLQNEKYGYLVPMHDPKAMAEGIKKALDKPIDKKRLAEGVKAFTEDEVFSQYKKVLGL
jgi:glycosyltransferase involved in cell wall biosynthesis